MTINAKRAKRSASPQEVTSIFLGIAIVIAIGLIDALTGSEISLGIFYVIPVVFVVWRAGVFAGCAIAFCGASMWVIADTLAGHEYSHLSILYWNGAVRLAFFLTIAILLDSRRNAEEALRMTQARFTGLFNFAPDPMIVIDEQGLITQANEQAATTFGYGAGELINVPAERLLAERFRSRQPEVESYITHPKKRHLLVSQSIAGIRKNGSEFPLEIIISPVESASRYDALVALRDISNRKSLEAQLRQYGEGRYHMQCEASIVKLKRELNALLADVGRPKRYDV